MVSIETKQLTGDDLLKMPHGAGERYELIEGELVVIAPTGIEHGMTENDVAFPLTLWNRQHDLGRVMTGEVGFYTRGDDHTVRAADVAYISYAALPREASLTGYGRVAPDLVVEIISPGNDADEIEKKTREWLDFGVRMVWNVYPTSQRVHVFTSPDAARILNATDRLDGGNVLPGFNIQVSEFFR